MVVYEHRGRLPKRGEELSAHFIADGELKICSKLSEKVFKSLNFPLRSSMYQLAAEPMRIR